MKRPVRFPLSGLLPFLLLASSLRAAPRIYDVTVWTPSVEQYGKLEFSLDLTAVYANPYDYDQVVVRAVFTAPSGAERTVDGFYMEGFDLNQTTGNLTPSGSDGFRVRFSPFETGHWQFSVTVTDATGTSDPVGGQFQCLPAGTSANKGFVRTGQTNYLQFDNGEQYIPIGENIAWQNNNAYLNYRSWLDGLIGNGGNFFRLWHAHWGLGVEWRAGNGFQGLRHYKQTNCAYQDWLFDYCAANGVYVMLALQHHGPVSTQVNPNWNDSPYNAANGGPCQNTIDFFTHAEARAHTRNRYRYIVARWGYARSILCWELFNEVHWTDNFQANRDLVAQWHFEMADYLQGIDPNTHLITTSYGEDLTDENVWSYPGFDFTQTHIYLNTPNLERALAHGNRRHLDAFAKPTLNGEFGLGGTADLADQDPDGIHLHNSLWGGLFSGGLGTGMTWWWDNYIHPRDLYYHFYGISEMVREVPFSDQDMSPAGAYATGAPGDLALTPSLGWGGIGATVITIDENGQVSPPGAALGQFLYGSQWNTQYRSPPSFQVQYPAAGAFSVTTATETGTAPRIAIWVDGSLQFQQDAAPNSTYTISVSAGAHTIKVDNTGTDWITVAAYTFGGLGSQVDAYVLTSAGRDVAAGWALNNRYNHRSVAANGLPGPTPPSSVIVDDFVDGTYAVRWYNPLTGAMEGQGEAVAAAGLLTIPLPAFLWDVVFVVDGATVGIREPRQSLVFDVYPNPAVPGAEVTVRFAGSPAVSRITLLDMNGRAIRRYTAPEGQIVLPEPLPSGQYWIVAEGDRQAGARPLTLAR